jgi:hypothetical protein
VRERTVWRCHGRRRHTIAPDEATVIGPLPGCYPEDASTTATEIVSALLSTATLNGAFLSLTSHVACNVYPSAPDPVRCATFSPARLVAMEPSG